MTESELKRTTMLLTERHQEILDEMGYSRTGVVRDMIENLAEARDNCVEVGYAPEICPICNRTADATIAGDSMMVKAVDDDTIEICREDGAATFLYIHRIGSE